MSSGSVIDGVRRPCEPCQGSELRTLCISVGKYFKVSKVLLGMPTARVQQISLLRSNTRRFKPDQDSMLTTVWKQRCGQELQNNKVSIENQDLEPLHKKLRPGISRGNNHAYFATHLHEKLHPSRNE